MGLDAAAGDCRATSSPMSISYRLSYWGPIQSGLRSVFGWVGARRITGFRRIASLPGAIDPARPRSLPLMSICCRERPFSARSTASHGDGPLPRPEAALPPSGVWRCPLGLAGQSPPAPLSSANGDRSLITARLLHLGVQTLTTGIFPGTWFGARCAGRRRPSSRPCSSAFVAVAFLVERNLVRGDRRVRQAMPAGGRR